MKKAKQRSDGMTLGQVSLPKDLLEKSKEYAKQKGLPWATWVRTLIIADMNRGDQPTHQSRNEPDGVNAVSTQTTPSDKKKKHVGFNPFDKIKNSQKSA